MVQFVKVRRADLAAIPAAFLSVSLSETGAEGAKATPEQRAKWAEDVRHMIDQFFEETGWSTK